MQGSGRGRKEGWRGYVCRDMDVNVDMDEQDIVLTLLLCMRPSLLCLGTISGFVTDWIAQATVVWYLKGCRHFGNVSE